MPARTAPTEPHGYEKIEGRKVRVRCRGTDCDIAEDSTPYHWHGSADLSDLVGPVDELRAYHKNPRVGDVPLIAASLRRHGQYRAIAVNRGTFTGRENEVLAGNHTLYAAGSNSWTGVARTFVDVDEATAKRIVLADNGTADVGTYDTAGLLELLQDQEDDLSGLGYSADDIERLEAELAATVEGTGGDDGSDRALTTGEALALVDVTMGDPIHQCHHGQVWRVGNHRLVVAKVSSEHHLWRHFLDIPEVRLLPYPEPYITLGELGTAAPLLLVQPNLYLAGHLLDKHASVHGDDSVGLITVDEP